MDQTNLFYKLKTHLKFSDVHFCLEDTFVSILSKNLLFVDYEVGILKVFWKSIKIIFRFEEELGSPA
jgi:hypothetical protein